MEKLFAVTGGSDRRVFIKGLGWVGIGVLLSTMGGCEACREAIENRPVRRRLRTGSPEVDADVATYRDAVAQMKALPASDPRSFAAQAAIHGTVSGGFNFCQHGSDHFFSWHRAYLRFFELICQSLTGNSDFGLPYWNWNQDNAIPAAFTDPTSPLFHPRVNTSLAGNFAVSDTNLDTIFGDGNFFTFSSQLEGSPHNTVHIVIGADMASGGSPLDPIFWPHHCMADYCWAKWNIELGNDNTNDAGWNDTSWSHFVDGDGNPTEITAALTTVMPLLAYRYEPSAIGSSPAAMITESMQELRTLEERIRRGADVRFDVTRRLRLAETARLPLAAPFSSRPQIMAGELAQILDEPTTPEMVFVAIDYARLPSANDFFVRVFLNLPEASRATPTDDPHFAGSFAFFGTHRDADEQQHKTDFLVNVTDTLRRLRSAGSLGDQVPITVQLVAVPVTGELGAERGDLMMEKVDLIVTPLITASP